MMSFGLGPSRKTSAAITSLLLVALGACVLIPCLSSGSPAAGAKTSTVSYWAFQPIRSPQIPTPQDQRWAQSPIDSFVLARLEQQGLKPAPPATKTALIRRVYFDLLGLPPSPEEVKRFFKDTSPDAYAQLIDRLLDSPQYGERWARHWLDVVRYADTGGFENDLFYDNAWKYRDYVIRSMNADKPFDRFVEEQVAGDELWPDDSDAITATAMFCVGPALPEAALMSNQLEYDWLTDSADTIGTAFLGLTMGCARCHDHKYDPITQKDYFSLQAIFGDTDRPYPQKYRDERIKGLTGLLSDTPIPKDKLNDPRCTILTEKQVGGFHLFHRKDPMEIHRLQRGELSKPREITPPAFPAILCSDQKPAFPEVPDTQRRAALARWLVSPENPLTARVLVNRVWGWHFGQAIVRTPNDFGKQGEPPTHPELLDWLASDFVAHGWSLKHLHRTILLSNAYQMQSAAGGPGMQIDPENKLLWHFPRNRLEGEEIRDAMLACAGTLNLKQFGPPVVPPLSSEELTGLFDAGSKWKVSKDPAEHTRRSIYVLERRTFIYPMFAAFDPPEVMSSCPRRYQTVVPTQALTLLNSPVAREQSATFAERLIQECPNNRKRIIERAWELAFGREPTAAERDHAVQFLQDREHAAAAARGYTDAAIEASIAGKGKPIAAARTEAVTDLCLALFNANEFIYVD